MLSNKSRGAVAIALVFLSWSTFRANAVQSPERAKDGLGADFANLERELEQAEEAYYSALNSFTGSDGAIVIDDKAKMPKDQRPDVLRKMDALLAQHTTNPEAAPLFVRTFQFAVGIDPEACLARFETLVERHADEPSLADAMEAAAVAASMSDKQPKWFDAVDKLAKRTKNEAVRAEALFISAQVQLDQKKLREAKATFERVLSLGSQDSEAAKRARRYIFEIERLQVGMEAPDFTTKTLDGKQVSLKSLRGKSVLLSFWASWCGPCLGELPHLTEAAAKLSQAGKPFEILAVSVDDDRGALMAAIQERKAPGIQTWDEKGSDNPVAELYNVRGLPTWYLIDANGVIRERDPEAEKLVAIVSSFLPSNAPSATPEKPRTP